MTSSKKKGNNYGARNVRKAFGDSDHSKSKPPRRKKPLGFQDQDDENTDSSGNS